MNRNADSRNSKENLIATTGRWDYSHRLFCNRNGKGINMDKSQNKAPARIELRVIYLFTNE